MKTGSINDNFRNAFYFAARINLYIFLAEQTQQRYYIKSKKFRWKKYKLVYKSHSQEHPLIM